MTMRSVAYHEHKQTIPSTSWEIDHGLFKNPVVSAKVYEGGVLTEILPKNVTFPSSTHVTITFSTPRTGEARLS